MPTRLRKPDWPGPKRGLSEERGAALVEFALVLPLLLILLLGLVDFGKAFTMWIDETHLANTAARYAAVGTWSGSSLDNSANLAAFETAMEGDADTQELRDTIDVNVCFPSGSGGVKGDPIRVDVSATYQFLAYIANFVPGLSPKTLTAHSVMRIEKDYTTPGFVAAHTC